jgi:hypothetical protein
MSKKLIATSSIDTVGATFMDWSILFLSGRNEYYHQPTNGILSLSSNPLTDHHEKKSDSVENAHGHKKNHPEGLEKCKKMTQDMLLFDYDFFTMYPFPLSFDTAADKLKIPVLDLHKNSNIKIIKDYRMQDYENLVQYLTSSGFQFIFLDNSPETAVYSIDIRVLGKSMLTKEKFVSVQEKEQEIQHIFYNESKTKWENLNLNDVWDYRERLALSTRPFHQVNSLKNTNVFLNKNHYYLDCREWWHMGTDTIKNVMNFCGVEIDPTRYDLWIPIYYQWQTIQHKKLKFCYQLQHILDCIVNGWYYPIDLSFNQEVVIQHCLIYRYGLNLKTWQLSKFPNNTQQLHNLLEPNIHQLNKY